MLTKPLISSKLSVPIEIGLSYFSKMAYLLSWGLPGDLPRTMFAGILGISLLIAILLFKKLSKTVRMGSFIALISLVPFPFVWIQKTFLWLPSVGLCIVVAGLFEYLFLFLTRFRSGKYFGIILTFCLLSATAIWGYNEGRSIVDTPIAIKLAVEQLSDEQSGPVYDSNIILESIPGLVSVFEYNDLQPEVTHKKRKYLQQLLQLHTMNREAIIVWQ